MLQYEGWAYVVGDFAVCVGKAIARPGEELKGLMVEVEYQPVQLPHLAQAALQACPDHTELKLSSLNQQPMNTAGILTFFHRSCRS